MNICSERHDEIVFEGRKCPFCLKIDDMQFEIDSLNGQIKHLEDKVP